jgi:hypothetical protein
MSDVPFIRLDPGMSWKHPNRIFVIANQTIDTMYINHDGVKIDKETAEKKLAEWQKTQDYELAMNIITIKLANGFAVDLSIVENRVEIDFDDDGWLRTGYEISLTSDDAIKVGETLIAHGNEIKRRASLPKSVDP